MSYPKGHSSQLLLASTENPTHFMPSVYGFIVNMATFIGYALSNLDFLEYRDGIEFSYIPHQSHLLVTSV